MAFDAAAVALGEFMLDDCRQEAGGGPAFLVGVSANCGHSTLIAAGAVR